MPISSQSASDRLVRSTAKILAFRDGELINSGSGLLMMLYPWGRHDSRFAPAFVTNRHLLEDADQITFQVPGNETMGRRVIDNHAPASGILFHPDPAVDLCIVPVGLEMVQSEGLHLAEFISSLDIWDQDRLDQLNAIETVIMIGYPDGLRDEEQLYPISRRGITATPAFARLNGQPDFMIDCACFPGSSGSPVFLFEQGFHTDKNNNTHLGEGRFGLLGFLYAGPVMNAGRLVASPPPTQLSQMVDAPLMMNLGICVRAAKLNDLIEIVRGMA